MSDTPSHETWHRSDEFKFIARLGEWSLGTYSQQTRSADLVSREGFETLAEVERAIEAVGGYLDTLRRRRWDPPIHPVDLDQFEQAAEARAEELLQLRDRMR